jgi:hypothetical protein
MPVDGMSEINIQSMSRRDTSAVTLVSRHHHSHNDPNYETKIQSALEGLHSGKYRNVKQAADKEGVSPQLLLP